MIDFMMIYNNCIYHIKEKNKNRLMGLKLLQKRFDLELIYTIKDSAFVDNYLKRMLFLISQSAGMLSRQD